MNKKIKFFMQGDEQFCLIRYLSAHHIVLVAVISMLPTADSSSILFCVVVGKNNLNAKG
jgi:hypothetical protein